MNVFLRVIHPCDILCFFVTFIVFNVVDASVISKIYTYSTLYVLVSHLLTLQ